MQVLTIYTYGRGWFALWGLRKQRIEPAGV